MRYNPETCFEGYNQISSQKEECFVMFTPVVSMPGGVALLRDGRTRVRTWHLLFDGKIADATYY